MQLAWLSLALITTVGYHLVMKVTPAAANPFLSRQYRKPYVVPEKV